MAEQGVRKVGARAPSANKFKLSLGLGYKGPSTLPGVENDPDEVSTKRSLRVLIRKMRSPISSPVTSPTTSPTTSPRRLAQSTTSSPAASPTSRRRAKKKTSKKKKGKSTKIFRTFTDSDVQEAKREHAALQAALDAAAFQQGTPAMGRCYSMQSSDSDEEHASSQPGSPKHLRSLFQMLESSKEADQKIMQPILLHKPLAPIEDGFAVWKPYVRPQSLYMIMKTIHDYGLGVEGLFRVPGSSLKVDYVEAAVKDGNLAEVLVELRENTLDMLAIADVMNHMFQQRPSPLVPLPIFQEMLHVLEVAPLGEEPVDTLLALLYAMPQDSLYLFASLLHLAHEALKKEYSTKMNAKSLAICIGRNVMYDPSPSLDVLAIRREVTLMSDVLSLFIRSFPEIFEGDTVRSTIEKRSRLLMEARFNLEPEEPTRSKSTLSEKQMKSPRQKASKFVSSNFQRLKRSTDQVEYRRKHKMLKVMNMALVQYGPDELCSLTFYEVQDILRTAGFEDDDIDDNETFLRKAILDLITQQNQLPESAFSE